MVDSAGDGEHADVWLGEECFALVFVHPGPPFIVKTLAPAKAVLPRISCIFSSINPFKPSPPGA